MPTPEASSVLLLFRYESTGLGDNNLSKLHRNMSSCLIELGRLDGAVSNLKSAVSLAPNSPYTHYIGYKLALLQDNTTLVSSVTTT